MSNNNGEWKATQAERWGFLRAKLEDQEKTNIEMKQEAKERQRTISSGIDDLRRVINKHLEEDAFYKKGMEGRVTRIEVKSGLIGAIAGFIGGFTSVLIFFKKIFSG